MTAILLALGIPARLHKAALIAAAVVAVIAAFLIWNHFDNRAAVRADRNRVEAETARKVIAADRAAERADEARQVEIQANNAAMREAIHDAVQNDPEAAARPAGPAARAAAEQLRKRQAGNQHATD